MATSFTRYADQQILNAVLRGVAIPVIPAKWHVGLLNLANGLDAATPPTRDNVVEVNGVAHAAYNRKPLGATTLTNVNGAVVANVKNDAQLLWDEATTVWGTIVGVGIYDAVTAGNLWIVVVSPSDRQRTIRVGDRLNVPEREIVVSGGLT